METIITAQNNKKRQSEQRSNNKAKKKNTNDISKVLTQVAENQKKVAVENSRNDMLKFIYMHGSKADKNCAYEEICNLAFQTTEIRSVLPYSDGLSSIGSSTTMTTSRNRSTSNSNTTAPVSIMSRFV